MLGKVFSPQYAIWLAPFAAVAWGQRRFWLAGLMALGIALTQVEFPAQYWNLGAGETYPVALVAVRNLVLLGALAVALSAMSSSSATARSVSVSEAMASASRPAARR